MRRFSMWLDGLSNWQYVAVLVSVFALVLIIAEGIFGLFNGPGGLRGPLTVYLSTAVVFIGVSAWKRWK